MDNICSDFEKAYLLPLIKEKTNYPKLTAMRYHLLFTFLLFATSSICLGQTRDSATSVGSTKFKNNGSKKFWMGANYRKEWATPITVPVLHLATDLGGLKPVKRGGGKQTKSLRLEMLLAGNIRFVLFKNLLQARLCRVDWKVKLQPILYKMEFLLLILIRHYLFHRWQKPLV
jgi:hypothetical protein